MLITTLLAVLALTQPRPGAIDPERRIIHTGWHDEMSNALAWAPLGMENQAHVDASKRGKLGLRLDHVPEGWPYSYQWSGVTQDVKVDVGRYPILQATVERVKGYAHLDIDVLDAHGKNVNTLRSTTLNAPGISTIDLQQSLSAKSYTLRLRLIVGGDNAGCAATYGSVRFLTREDAAFLSSHAQSIKLSIVGPGPAATPVAKTKRYDVFEICASPEQAGLNDSGLVAGVSHESDSPAEAFIWHNGKVVWHSKRFTAVAGPNSKGQVALGDGDRLFVWERGKTTECKGLETLGMGSYRGQPQRILGIDDRGVIVVMRYGLESTYSLQVWPPHSLQAVQGPGPGTGNPMMPPFTPTAMGPDGSLAGTHYDGRGFAGLDPLKSSAYWSRGGGITNIGDGTMMLDPLAISSKGEVVGATRDIDPKPFWWRGGSIEMLDMGGFDARGQAKALNSHGEVVGWVAYATFDPKTGERTGERQMGAVWLSGRLFDANDFLPPKRDWEIQEAWAVNARGDFLALGFRKSAPSGSKLLLVRAR